MPVRQASWARGSLARTVELRPACHGGRRRICVRGRDRADRIHRGQPRHAFAQAAFPGAKRVVRQADRHQQCRNAGHHPGHPGHGARNLCFGRHRDLQGNQDLCPHRARRQHRPDRSAVRHEPAHDHQRHRRRRHQRRRHAVRLRFQGGPDRRPLGRLSHTGAPRHAAGLRKPEERPAPWWAPADWSR